MLHFLKKFVFKVLLGSVHFSSVATTQDLQLVSVCLIHMVGPDQQDSLCKGDGFKLRAARPARAVDARKMLMATYF